MKKILAIFLIFFAFSLSGYAQYSRYIIRFKDKGSSPFTFSMPLQFLSQRAIDRRSRYHISLDSTDLPVTPKYIDSVRLAGNVEILNASKWLNSVSIRTTDSAALARINRLPFVVSVKPIAVRLAGLHDKFTFERPAGGRNERQAGAADFFRYGQSFAQVHIHHGEFLHNLGLHGEQMILGLLDAGFYHYTSLHAFDSVNINHQVLGVYDFVAEDNSVVEDDPHGMECFSTIASNQPGVFVGTAPKANYFLFRTEDANSEYPVEEHNWVCGAERLDSCGGDVISSSLGYSEFDDPSFNHTYADMNGHTTMAAIGASLAARKGMLVLIAAGNEGTSSWHYITTPADADSILAVGAVRADSAIATFSSYGPSSDGRVKPDVASVGVSTVIESPSNTVATGSGTSFATPNLAGLATCLWEAFPELNNEKIIRAMQASGDRASQPDSRTGYGIPDMKKAFLFLLQDFATASASVSNCTASITWTSKDVNAMRYEVERSLPGSTVFNRITTLPGSDTVLGTHSYHINDSLRNIQSGVIRYRIKEVIDTSTGGFAGTYLDTVAITLSTPCLVAGSATTITLIPNPAGSQTNLEIVTTSAVHVFTVEMFDSKGSLVMRGNYEGLAGTNLIPLPVGRYARGKYFIRVYADGVIIGTQQLLKL